MKLENYDDRDGKKVWLRSDECRQLIEQADGTTQKIAFDLGLRCGLRSAEITQVTPQDVTDTPIGKFLRVWEGKDDKYRETPLTSDTATKIEAIADVRDVSRDEPLVDVTTRTLRNWVSNAGDQLAEQTDDVGWSYLGPHDLRRTWGTLLTTEHEVEPGLVMEWGGWDNWETFREHYLGAYSLDAQKQQIEKVDWL